MTTNPSNVGGVAAPSDTSNDLGIPDFLKREQGEVLNTAPAFTTQEDPATGQVEVVIEGETVLENLAPQETPVVEQQVEAPVTPEGNGGEEVEQQVDPGIGHNASADPAEMRRDFFKDINRFGKQSGEGASALGRLGLRALRAAADGVISAAKPQGGGKDDATLIYEAYTAMDSKHAEHTPGGAKANASKLRQIIGMGCMTTLSDPVAVGDRVVRAHTRMTDAELKPKALFAALVDVSREQMASDAELTDAAIEACLTKTKADKSLEKEWQAIYKRVEGLVTGENSHGLKDNSDAALGVAKMVEEIIKNYAADGTRQERIDGMLELGYTVAQATAIVDKKIAV